MIYIDALTTFALGLYAGAMLTEGAVMVPQWKSIPADQFFNLHKSFGHKLYKYFAPITILGVISPQINLIVKFTNDNQTVIDIAVSILMLVCLSTFYLYFKTVNAKFATRGLSDDELPLELDKWHKVHIFRTVIAVIAFGLACLN